MTVRLALLAFVVLSALLPARAGAGDRTARRLKRSALAHYQEGDYASAARDFRAAYEIEAEGELLYALGQSLRLAGDCAGAIDAYQDFLITGPDPAQAGAAREKIDVCRHVLAPLPPPQAAAPDSPPRQPRRIARPVATAAPERHPSRSWARDPIGGSLVAAGFASAAVGTYLLFDSAAGEEGSEPDHGERTAGGILIGAGGGLIAAAVMRYMLVSRDPRDDEIPVVSASIDPGAAGFWVSGRF